MHRWAQQAKETSPRYTTIEVGPFLGIGSSKVCKSLANKIDLVHGTVGENLFVKMGSNGTTKWSCHSAAMAWWVDNCCLKMTKKIVKYPKLAGLSNQPLPDKAYNILT